MWERDKPLNHSFTYLVMFNGKGIDCLKCFIPAKDKKNALRIAFNRLCKLYPERDISRARIAGVYPNKRCTIKKSTREGLF